MKKILTTILLTALCVMGHAQHRADRQSLSNPDSFSMILLGDPQGYTKYDINQPLLELCMAWISDNIEQLNIKGVLCTGDLVEQNENIVRNRRMLNQTSKEMWEAVSDAFEWIDNKVPYMIAPGNHDYGYKSAECGITHFPEYFPFERNTAWRDIVVSDYPNRNGVASLENAAFEFKSDTWGNLLVITSEFAPRDEVLAWTLKLISSEKYKNHKVIYITHSYLKERTAEYTNNEKYKITPRNWGQQIWEKLIQPSENICMVISGHTGNARGGFEETVAYRVDKNASGKDVHQMMFNVQQLGGGWEGNGGDGWLRILEFMPDGKTIKIKTYSPLFGISPSTKHLAHRNEPYDRFDIVID